jgi:4-nitrophenyl phosphatase
MTGPRSWALDLDGVIWTGGSAIAGSARAVGELQAAGERIAFVTNNSFATVAEQEAKLASFGIDGTGMVVTSAMAGASLVDPDQRVYVLGGPGVVEAASNRGAAVVDDEASRAGDVDVVLVGLDWHLSYQRLTTAVLAVLDGARLIATNTDSTYPTEHGLFPGGGAIVRAVEYATGVAAEVAGKPQQPQADIVRDLLGRDGIMVGDRPETDGAFARRLGYGFGLVLSGVTSSADLPTSPAADIVADDLAGLISKLM